MTSNVPRGHDLVVLTTPQLELLLRALLSQGYELIGPTIREGAIVYDHVASTEDLPVGWTDEQQGGKYHLKRREDDAYFGYNLGPHAWKKFLSALGPSRESPALQQPFPDSAAGARSALRFHRCARL
jgi:hypothetical protein